MQQIVVSIMHATERKENMEQVTGHHPPTPEDEKENPFNREEGERQLSSSLSPLTAPTNSSVLVCTAHKQILTGAKSQTLHREELTMSGAERRVRAKVEENARVQQRKRSSMTERGTEVKRSSGKRSPVSQPFFRIFFLTNCLIISLYLGASEKSNSAASSPHPSLTAHTDNLHHCSLIKLSPSLQEDKGHIVRWEDGKFDP